MRVLLIEDDSATAQSIELMLKSESFNVYTTDLGEEGIDLGKIYDYDIILLDLNLPDMSGFEVLRSLRVSKVKTPILILSGLAGIEDKVRGLGFGADDYMTKPFSFAELVARLRAVKRRAAAAGDPQLRVADLVLNPASREVFRGEEYVSLTRTEYSLLERLMYRSGKVVSRRSLIESVWGFEREIEGNTLDAFMHLLRNKVDRPGQTKLIHTIRGVGYMIRSDEPA